MRHAHGPNAGAILMCEQAPIQDLDIKQLCKSIVSSQQTEMAQMRTRLNQLAAPNAR